MCKHRADRCAFLPATSPRPDLVHKNLRYNHWWYTGGHIPAIWLRRLTEVWGAEVQTVYGLSEFGPGNAMQCKHCGGYHYWTA